MKKNGRLFSSVRVSEKSLPRFFSGTLPLRGLAVFRATAVYIYGEGVGTGVCVGPWLLQPGEKKNI